MKARLKEGVGPGWALRVRQLRRLRWITKYRLMMSFRGDVGVWRRVSYVLFDPELESFSFELADERGVLAALAVALECPEGELVRFAAETHTDPELNARLRRHVRWRMDFKRHMPIGSRLAWYVTTRVLKPELVVETGIYMGLGSLVLLRALERNAEEGHPGDLMSFDTNPLAGMLVRKELHGRWHRVVGSTHMALPSALRGRRVGMLLHDTAHTEETQRLEFETALAHAAPRLVLVDGSGGYVPTLKELCQERGGTYHRVHLRSQAHVHPGSEYRFALFNADREASPGGSGLVSSAYEQTVSG
jgi:hypothetical protein